jgi:hypothetical protein
LYLSADTISIIVGVLMVSFLLVPLFLKQYWLAKTRGKIGIKIVDGSQKGIFYLAKMEGLTTESINEKKDKKHKRAYIPIGKHKVRYTTKDEQTGEEKEIELEEGNIYVMDYPIGMPHFCQVPLHCMDTKIGSPTGINYYSELQDMPITDEQIAAIKEEKATAAVLQISNDTADMINEIQKRAKGGGIGTIIYILLGVILIGILAIVYKLFM